MTVLGTTTKVQLSMKDWLGIVAVAMTILSAMLTVYLHHDRQLTTVLTRQEAILDRIDRVERRIDQ